MPESDERAPMGSAVPETVPARRRMAFLSELSRGDRVLVGATLSVIVAVVAAALAVLPSSTAETAMGGNDLPTLAVEAPATTTTLAPTTTTTAPSPAPAPRSVPAPPPRKAKAAAPILQIGEIQIPRIGLVHKVYEGVTLRVINHGPGHWPGSAVPGQLGNAVFAGHRTTYSHPFRRLNELVPGDEIIFKTAEGTFTYHVTRQQIVKPTDVHIINPTPEATITLFACHPPGSARQRIVVRGLYHSGTRV
ncbi:MAG: class E sortase [Acidimicrobiia bacterium]